jgi:Phosphodiester glycosidase
MQYQVKTNLSGNQRISLIIGTIILALPLVMYGWLHFLRPPRTAEQRELFQGVLYQRIARNTPRPVLIHLITIDLTAPGVKPFVTKGLSVKATDQTETQARTVPEFVNDFKLQLAINGSYFNPFHEVTPWNYYPHSRHRANVLGQMISNGNIYSPVESNWHVLCFAANNQAQIPGGEECPAGTVHGIAGAEILLRQGKISKVFDSNIDKPYPCVVAAIDKQGKKLWLVLVDGKQPLYSEGITKSELTAFIMELGANTALLLDGGGSTTLAISTPSGAKLLNAPIHTKLPMVARPVANHLGFYANAVKNK